MRGVLALADTVESRRLFRILVENPHAPRVADDGLVIVQDWKRPGQLGSAVRCFDSTGRELWAKHFRRYGVASAEFAEDGTQVLVSRLDGTLLQLDARIGREIAGSESRAKVTQ